MPPLRGMWNRKPVEGDKFVSAEIDWGVTTKSGNAVQFALSGNSPVAMSQLVAFAVDNSKCASDTQFLFPDSGYILNVPAYNQGIFPVFTNALMFYVVSVIATVGDRTVFQVFNSMPPPVSVQPSMEMTNASIAAISPVNGTTSLIAPTISGTIQGWIMETQASAAGNQALTLIDGTGRVLFNVGSTFTTTSETFSYAISGLDLRFFNGLSLTISASTIAAGQGAVSTNIYYSIP
jgi:hypothetical protein